MSKQSWNLTEEEFEEWFEAGLIDECGAWVCNVTIIGYSNRR